MATAGEIYDRRKKVFQLRMYGLTNKAIAVTLGVDERTIDNDIVDLKSFQKRYIQNFDEDVSIAEHLYKLKEIESMLWDKYLDKAPKKNDQGKTVPQSADDYKAQLFIMKEIRELMAQIERIMMSVGLWTKKENRLPIDDTSFEARVIKLREERKLGPVIDLVATRLLEDGKKKKEEKSKSKKKEVKKDDKSISGK